jgi:hypothetical protein
MMSEDAKLRVHLREESFVAMRAEWRARVPPFFVFLTNLRPVKPSDILQSHIYGTYVLECGAEEGQC